MRHFSVALYRAITHTFRFKGLLALPRCWFIYIFVTMFTKGGGQWLEMMVDSGADCIGIDWTTQLKVARKRLENKVAIQGNIDPCALYGSEETIHRVVSRTMSQFINYKHN